MGVAGKVTRDERLGRERTTDAHTLKRTGARAEQYGHAARESGNGKVPVSVTVEVSDREIQGSALRQWYRRRRAECSAWLPEQD